MLVRLLPDDIERRWPVIREAILSDAPPHVRDIVEANENAISSLLFALLDGTLHCWILVEYEDKEAKIKAVVTTTITMDAPSGIKNLLIYSVTAYKELSKEQVMDSYNSLKEFARSLKCSKVLSFTNSPDNMEMAKSMGGKVSQTLIEMEV